MKEGFYSVAYSGMAGYGFGMVVLDTDCVVGADAGGGRYDGTYRFNPRTNLLDLDLVMSFPAGASPVQTGIPLSEALRVPLKVALPRDLGAEKPVRVDTPLGPVDVVFRKVRDFPD